MNRTRIVICSIVAAGLMIAQQALTNYSVLNLVKAGMGDEIIINMINTQTSSFSLSAHDLIALKTGGVSAKVIGAMVVKNSGAPKPAAITTSVIPTAGPVQGDRRLFQTVGSVEGFGP